jgi:6-oxo-cyclohex-1-ene-carbonyl-CoA hydrolase
MNSATLCESWSAHQAQRFGLISECFPVLRVGETFVPNPLVNTDTWLDASGRIVFGEFKVGEARQEGKERLASGEIDLTPLDEAVERLAAKLLETFPNCTRKTIESMRKHKLQYWDRNRESNRSWLGLNMMTEAAAGFRAFNEGGRDTREVDFVRMRQRLAAGERWTPEFIDSLIRRSDTNGSAQ